MIYEEIREDAGVRFIGKTDAQILRELYGVRGRRHNVLPDEQSEHQDQMAAMAEDEPGSQTH
jgi:hypothetical protein